MAIEQAAETTDTTETTPADRPPARDVMGVLVDAMVAAMLDLGARTGLTRALGAGPRDAAGLARDTGGDERIALEWLRSLHAAGLVERDGGTFRFAPAAAAALAAPPGSPTDLSAGVELYGALCASVPAVAAAFAGGGAVPAADYPAGLATAMARMSDGWTSYVLPDVWVPEAPGLAGTLAGGGRIAEIGCGSGGALAALAARYPAARAVGFDLDRRAIADGRARLAERGLGERVTLRAEDAVDGLPGSGAYDLVLALSVLHDAVDLDGLLAAVAASLAVGGYLLVVETPPLTGDPAAMLLATSTLFCVPSTAARGGDPRGTLGLPPAELRAAAGRAGLVPAAEPTAVAPLVAAHLFRAAG